LKDLRNNSDAFKANLIETTTNPADFSENETMLLESFTNIPMLEKKIRNYLEEKHHRFPSLKDFIEMYRNLVLENVWSFIKHEQRNKILIILADEVQFLSSLGLNAAQTERIKDTLFGMFNYLYEFYKLNRIDIDIVKYYAETLEKFVQKDQYCLMKFSNDIRKIISTNLEDSSLKRILFRLSKKSLVENTIYWSNIKSFTEWEYSLGIEYSSDTREIDSIINEQFPKDFFKDLADTIHDSSKLEDLDNIPVYSYFTGRFRKITDVISYPEGKINYIFYLLEMDAMLELKEYLLFDLNRVFKQVSFKDERKGKFFITRAFDVFTLVRDRFLNAVLDCIRTLGVEIIEKTEEKFLLDHFSEQVINFGFVYPGVKGVDLNWQTIMNREHVKNIRVWLEIISKHPSRCGKLLSALLINLRVGGVYISDTDLFQHDITKFLNSDITSSYHIVRQIAVLFPVYFKDIGAEGELRSVSTAIDELFHRKDRLIHFLRKQIHAESNNTNIDLVNKIFMYWLNGDKSVLEKKIPENVLSSLDENDELFKKINKISKIIFEKTAGKWEDLFTIDETGLIEFFNSIETVDTLEKNKIKLLFRLGFLLRDKYHFNPGKITDKLKSFNQIPIKVVETLENCLERKHWNRAIKISFDILSYLKETVLSPKETEPIENIYYKRHIAIGIPSMYGEYREPKFESLGMIFRMEQFVSSLMDKVIDGSKIQYISAETLNKTLDILNLFKNGLELGGISNENLNSDLSILSHSMRSSSFSTKQYTNIFEFLAEDISNIVTDFFLGVHDRNLKIIIEQNIEKKKMVFEDGKKKECFIHKLSEEFYRDVITSSFLIQKIDNMINNILSLFRAIPANLSNESLNLIMSYRSDSIISVIGKKNNKLDNQVFLGAKGYFLKKIKEYDMPVPLGFILTTEFFRRRSAVLKHPEIEKEILSNIFSNLEILEKKTGLEYGNPENPLTLSVRSGSTISMPGAMNTFLNVGMNDEFVEKLCKKENYGWTAWDCYRRLIQCWGMNSEIDRDVYDAIMADFKKVYKVEKKIDFKPSVMKEMVKEYKRTLDERGVVFEQDLKKQLLFSIRSVFNSWDSGRAEVYRKKLNIAPEWGTAVIIQKMVLGNINYDSGTGVVFTREPFSGDKAVKLYGDFVMCSQGEDVVGGLVHPFPVSEKQRLSMKNFNQLSMEKDFPEIYNELKEISLRLVNDKRFGHQEIEFTFESKRKEDLHILQIRPYHQVDSNFSISIPDNVFHIGDGTGIGGHVLTGRVAFTIEDIFLIRDKYPSEKIIVVRPDTVSDDINMIFESDGLLTSRGGATSHAAVTAVRLGKTGVVNCRSMVFDSSNKCVINNTEINSCDRIVIDGKLGFIYTFY